MSNNYNKNTGSGVDRCKRESLLNKVEQITFNDDSNVNNKIHDNDLASYHEYQDEYKRLDATREIDNNAISATGRLETLPVANLNQPSKQVAKMSVNTNTAAPSGAKNTGHSVLENPSLSVTADLINRYLSSLAHDRDTWLGIGAALKHEYGDGAFSVWTAWSERYPDFCINESRSQWKSFGKNLNRTFGYIVNQAKSAGVDYADFLRNHSDVEHQENQLINRPLPQKTPSKSQTTPKENSTLSRFIPAFKQLKTAPISHPYFKSKNVLHQLPNVRTNDHKIYLNAKQYIPKNALIIPIKNYSTGKLTGYQTISETGRKIIISGSKLSGSAYVFKGENSKIILSEGVATSYTIKQATGHKTLCCFNKNSLKTMAIQLVTDGMNPDDIYLAFDHDKKEGIKKTAQELGKELANQYGFRLFIPKSIGDWNDAGVESCRKAFNESYINRNISNAFKQKFIGDILQKIIKKSTISIIKSDMGTGKTYSIKLLIKQFFKDYGRMPNLVYIAPLVRLNEQMVKDINEFVKVELGYKGRYMSFYKDIIKTKNKDVAGDMARCCATTMQSSDKVFQSLSSDIDLLVVDESESVSSSLTSSVVKKKVKVIEVLEKIGSCSRNVVLFDADAGDLSRKLAEIFKPNNTADFYKNNYRSQSGFKARVINEGTDAERLAYMEKLVIDRYKSKEDYQVIPVFCMTKTEANDLGAVILEAYLGAKILTVTGDDSTEFSKVLENKELIREYDYFIYTSAAGTGVSFDQKDLFTETYCIAINNIGTAGVNNLTQGSYRIRNPFNNTIIFLLPSDKKINSALPDNVKELKRELEDDADYKVDKLTKDTNYQHGKYQQWLIDLAVIGGAEYINDKNNFTKNLIQKLKESEIEIIEIDIKTMQADEAAGLAKKEANKVIKAIQEEALTNEKRLSDEEIQVIQAKKMHSIKVSHEEDALLLKDKVITRTELSYKKYNAMINEEKLLLVKEYKKGLIRKAENIEASGNTRKANVSIVKTDFENVGFDPLTKVSRLIECPLIMKKVESLAFKESIPANYFTSQSAKWWLTRNIKTIKLMEITCTKVGISKNPALIYRNIINCMGHEVVTVRQLRTQGKVNRSKPTPKTLKITKNEIIFSVVERRDEEGTSITDYSNEAQGAKTNMITTGGKGTTWTPVILDKTHWKRTGANMLISLKSGMPRQIWASASDSINPKGAPKIA